MNCINNLIKCGFVFTIKDGHVAYEYTGSNPPKISKVKPLLEELKLHKTQAMQYIEKLIIYEISDDTNFDIKIQAYIDSSIEWLRIYIYKKAKKVILVGIDSQQERRVRNV